MATKSKDDFECLLSSNNHSNYKYNGKKSEFDDLQICRCCLSTNVKMESSTEETDLLLENLTGCQSLTSTNWLCYHCSRLIKRLKMFRKLCAQADMALKEYYHNFSDNVKSRHSFIKKEYRKIFFIYHHLSYSNTLCIDVALKENDTQTDVVSSSPGDCLRRNYSQDMVVVARDSLEGQSKIAVDKHNIDDQNVVEAVLSPKEELDAPFEAENLKDWDDASDSHKMDSHACKDCGSTFDRASSLKQHRRTIHKAQKKRRYECAECGKTYRLSKLLAKHLITSHSHVVSTTARLGPVTDNSNNGSSLTEDVTCLVCNHCDKRFTSVTNLRRHALVHSDAKPFSCERCGKAFKREAEVRAHAWTHAKVKPYPCEECGATFHCPSYLRIHSMRHTGERPHTCTVCGKTFKTVSYLTRHKLLHTGVRPYKCEGCGLGFKGAFELKEHARVHTGERPFSCDVCGKPFRRVATLKLHKRIHTGEKPYLCKVCGKAFARGGELTAHTKTHTGERPFPCNMCGKAFADRGGLRTHWRVHTGEKPFKCDVCSKSFTGPSYLKVHRRTHTGEYFPCDLCNYRGLSMSRVKMHRMTHTGEKPHACDVCPFKTTTSKHLNKHKLTHTKKPFC